MLKTTETIQGKARKVYAWEINPRETYNAFKNGKLKSAKDLSWALLNDDKSLQVMDSQQYGDNAESNFALSVFENALDWTLGMVVVRFLEVFTSQKKLPKPFRVFCTRKGDVFIKTNSGRIYDSSLQEV